MIRVLALGIILAASPVLAQQPPAQPAQFTLTLAPDQMRILALALQERPYREVAPLIAEIQRQVSEQQRGPAPKSPDGQ